MSVFVNMSIKLAVLLFAIIYQKSCQSYLIPKPEITVYSPKGFSVSIPHTHGISSVTFQGNINRELRNFNDIDLLSNVTKVENGKWIIRDFNSRLQSGDLISYRLLVVKKCLRYWFQGERFLVKEGKSLLVTCQIVTVSCSCKPAPICTSDTGRKGSRSLHAEHSRFDSNHNTTESANRKIGVEDSTLEQLCK
uniref:CBM39 domain-containing protein n=1 Tax=Photinus pyralis TaxID=7054 RepID=A0A1Y1NHY0_PHOPY